MADSEGHDPGEKMRQGEAGPDGYDAENFGKELRDRIIDKSTRWQRREHRRSGLGGIIAGLAIVTLGSLLLLQNLGLPQFEHIGEYWPVILIVLGLARAIGGCSWRGRFWGGLVGTAGVLFLLHNLGYIHGNVWRMFWPLILIGVGLLMLVGTIERRSSGSRTGWGPGSGPGPGVGSGSGPGPGPFTSRTGTANRLNEWATFGGVRRRIDTQDFEGGEANATFGGVELDLRRAATKLEEVTIEANAVFGGVEMRVPDNWEVSVRGTGVFGGYEDKTSDPGIAGGGKRPRLVITGYAVFGGVSVKN